MPDDELNFPEHYECTIELRVAGPDSYVTMVTLPDGRNFKNEQPIVLDAETRNQITSSDPLGYGQLLWDTFLSGAPSNGLAVAQSEAKQKPLRLRLIIPPEALELHTLNWEWLYDANADTRFAASPTIALSRFMFVDKPLGQPLKTQPLRMLVVISNPKNLSEYNLSPLNATLERQKIEEALAKVGEQVECQFLEGPATLDNIRDHLEAGHFHVLHVLGHGYFKQKGFLVLEDQDGNVDRVDEDRFDDLFLGQHEIRLIVLAACASAARSQANAFVGLGPRLVTKGVPAVVAMQRQIQMDSARIFTEHFYRYLSQSGVVDAAVNAARYRLYLDGKTAGDWGIPVVFMRAAKGTLFYPAPVDVGARLPPALRERFVPVLREFVNREAHFDQFQQIVTRQQFERIVYVHSPRGMGKTWLLDRCAAWCSEIERNYAWCHIDFGNKDTPRDYLLVLREIAKNLNTALQTGNGGAADPFAEFQNLAQQTEAAGAQYAMSAEARQKVSAAFVRSLVALPSERRIVIFMDTLNALENPPSAILEWLWADLLTSFQDKTLNLGHITLFVAHQKPPLADPDGRWYHVLSTVTLDPLTREQFVLYARRRGFRQQDEATLGDRYDTIVATRLADTPPGKDPEPLTPLTLSLVLDNLKKMQR